MVKFCNHCSTEHELTKEYWYKIGTSYQCKVYQKEHRRSRTNITREARNKYTQEWRKSNPEYMKKAAAKYYSENRKKVIQRNFEYTKKRRSTDQAYNLSIILRQRLYSALKKSSKVGSAVQDLGCSIEEFKQHIELLFTEGMTWENHGIYGWHIDHIIPISAFNLEDPEEFKKAVHYTNLQPMWAIDNIRKSNKIG